MQQNKRDRVKKRISITASDEEVLAVIRQYPIVLRRPLIWGMILILVGLLPWTIAEGNNLSWKPYAIGWMIFIVLCLIIYWLRSWISWHYSVYVLTDQRIMVVRQSGFFTREVADLALHNIQNVNYTIRGFQGALFRIGKLKIETLSGGGDLELEYVYKPAILQKQIMDEVYRSSNNPKKSTN